ncbi:MAG: tRNA (adenosine(37)-N6)-dimethylallyltransferase MiaA [Clostridiales bacterium]|nr:tRNA (adenosine(37)-N6)-dimethylallyltransferase MiaA [Clostridiales bacterium]
MVQANRIKAVAIVGCTAVGKSAIALDLAKKFDGELIGADSMQIYRGFDIGTGKLTKEECRGITHKLIDVADGDDDFSVGEYVELAKNAITDTAKSGKLPIIVGGTGMYVYSLLSGCDFAGTSKNDAVRVALKTAGHFLGGKTLHDILSEVDSSAAQKISPNDVKRVIRALEIFYLTGAPKSLVATQSEPPFDALTIVVTLPRELLYERINARVKSMFECGLIDEVNGLKQYVGCGAMQALGYKQIIENPDMPYDELVALVSQKTRNYAKRQMTYFNNMKLDKVFIDARDTDKIERAVTEFLEK